MWQTKLISLYCAVCDNSSMIEREMQRQSNNFRPQFTDYAKETGRVPILGTMAAESAVRTTTWLRYGCNAFDNARATSAPLSFWTDDDIWEYIHRYNIPYCKIYDMGYVVSVKTGGGLKELVGSVE